jgi:hypothetical protein
MKRKILIECLEIARKMNTPDKHPDWGCYHHFSFIIQHGKIVGYGMNRKGDPVRVLGYAEYGKIHSEFDAYQQVKGIMEDGDFVVVNIRLGKRGSLRDSSPCVCCNNFLRKMGCKEVWFSMDNGYMARMMI